MVYKSGPIFLSFYCFLTIHACDGRTDRQTDRILIARQHLHYMQRGKNVSHLHHNMLDLVDVCRQISCFTCFEFGHSLPRCYKLVVVCWYSCQCVSRHCMAWVSCMTCTHIVVESHGLQISVCTRTSAALWRIGLFCHSAVDQMCCCHILCEQCSSL